MAEEKALLIVEDYGRTLIVSPHSIEIWNSKTDNTEVIFELDARQLRTLSNRIKEWLDE